MRIPLASWGRREMLQSAVAAAAGIGGGCFVAHAVGWWPLGAANAAAWLLLLGFVLSFFRDPERVAPAEPGLLAPADGTVTDVTNCDEPEFLRGPATRIGIFLSVFNCHVNRAPCAGTVAWCSYRPGRFHDARRPEAVTENEANWIGLETPTGRIAVKQISGAIARRIVCAVREGDALARGARLGMIKFGSRTELYVPRAAGVVAAVRPGDRVRGGVTLLARPAAAGSGA